MQTVFEKIIEKLEEQKSGLTEWAEDEAFKLATDKAIEIVKQEAEKYNVMIDVEYCFQSCGCTEMCGKCSRIANGDTDYYESICAFSEQYNNGWIPCSDKLPPQPEVNPIFENKPLELYLVSVKGADYPIRAFWNGKFFTDGWSKLDAVAWQPLPEPYNPTGMNRAKTKDGKYEPYLGGWK